MTITDFRCFEHAHLSFRRPSPKGVSRQANMTVILGINGAGKSSLLQALALGLLNEGLRDTGLLFRNIVRRGPVARVATLTADCEFDGVSDGFEGSGQVVAEVKRHLSAEVPTLSGVKLPGKSDAESRTTWEAANTSTEAPGAFFLVAYGAQRRVSPAAQFDLARQDRRFHLRAQRVATLFVDDVPLVPLAAWWPKSTVHAEVQELLDKVLPEELRLMPRLDESGELLVTFRGSELPETALSDGYRAFLGWFGDLLYRLSQVRGRRKLRNVQGVVLVDEIDLHLHPAWQQDVIERVSSALPSLQFVVSTHSPLIVGGVRKESLRVLTVDAHGAATISCPEEETYGRTADQILLSDAFGLAHVRPAAFVKELATARQEMQAGDVAKAVRYTRMLALGEAGKAAP